MNRTNGFSLAKGPVGIIGLILLAGGILGLLFGSTSFTTHAPSGDVTGGSWLGIEGNGWTWLAFAAAGVILLMSAPMHWGAKTMAMIVGIVFIAACVIAAIDSNHDVFGVAAGNTATLAVWGIAGAVLLVLAMLPRVGRRRDVVVEDDAAMAPRRGRFMRRRDRTVDPVDEPVATTERRV